MLVISAADVNHATANNDHTVLSLACAGGHELVVEFLLKSRADPKHLLKVGCGVTNIRTKDYWIMRC